MNKILNNVTTIGKSFYGLVLYFGLAQILNFILKSFPNLSSFQYNVILIINEFVTVLLLVLLYKKRLKKDFIDFDKNYKKYLSIGFNAWFIGIIIMIVSNLIIHTYIINTTSYNQAANIAIMIRYPLYSVISIVMIGPFIEEMVFRYGFKINIKNKKLYYILSVLIFTSLHVFNGISSPIELLYFIPYGSLALAFSYILDKTDNIFTTTIIHTFHNTLVIVLISMMNFI